MMEKEISRKNFLKGAAMGMAGVVAAGCLPAAASAQEDAPIPAFLIPPEVPDASRVVAEYDCDVLVIGTGTAGNPAVLAALEEGAAVIGIDKGEDNLGFSGAGEVGCINSKIQQEIGIVWPPKDVVMNQLMKDMLYRPNPRILGYWYDHSGEDFDWAIEGMNYTLFKTSYEDTSEAEIPLRPKLFPKHEPYDYRGEYYPYFHGSLQLSNRFIQQNLVEKASAKGAAYFTHMYGEQLIQDESGRVVGAYAYDDNGDYHRFNAAKGVVITTGGIGGNPEMMEYYVKHGKDFKCAYSRKDSKGKPANTGDGHRMAIWAGAGIAWDSFAPMTHSLGGALGLDAFLQVNARGERFTNEDIPGQNLVNQQIKQPGHFSFQIFDDNWRDQLECQGCGHGYINKWLSAGESAEKPWICNNSFSGVIDDEHLLSKITAKADTLEELAELLEIPVDTFVATVARYNELAEKGYDEDLGKVPTRLFPLVKPPFYGSRLNPSAMLVCPGGIKVDSDLHALTQDDQVIPGLYVASNAMSGRFAIEYPVTVAGISISTGLTFGRLAGANAAKGV